MPGTLAELAAAFSSVPAPGETAVALAGMGLAAAGAAAMAAPALGRLVLPPPRETRLADMLPFEAVLRDGKTIRCGDGRLVRVVEFLGLDTTPLSEDERHMLMLRRKRWIEDLAEEGEAEIKIVVTRRRTGVVAAGAFPADIALMEEVADAWQGPLAETYRNRMFAVVSVRGRIEQARARLDLIAGSAEGTLRAFRPVELGLSEREGTSPLLAFWYDLLNPGDDPDLPLAAHRDGLSDRLCASTLEFAGEAGIGTFRRGEEVSLIAALGVRRWGDVTSSDMVASLLALPLELTMLHLIEPQTQVSALRRLQQRRTAAASLFFGQKTALDIDDAMAWSEDRGDDHQSLVRYQLTVFAHAPDRQTLSANLQNLRRAFAENGGVRAVKEGAVIAPLFFSLFPGRPTYVRECDMLSQNVAELVPLESPVPGDEDSDWGKGPVAVFRSLGGAPYMFQFHVSAEQEEVGHTLVIGPTGSGKTTFLTFLIGNALRHRNLRAYLFDSMLGAYIFTTAFGGRYLALQADDEQPADQLATLNPLRMSLNDANRTFLRLWLELLSGCTDEQSKEAFGHLVSSLEPLPGPARQLATLYNTAFETGSPAHAALRQWVDENQRGRVFNGVADTLDLTGTRLVGFDMTRVFADEELVTALIPYLMHRIRATVAEANAPYVMFIDETAHMLRNQAMAQFFEEELQQARKRSGAVICAFQEPASLWMHGDRANIITTACKTRVFLPNADAKLEQYAPFGLTDFEWAFIRGQLRLAAQLPYAALVKRDTPSGPESVIIDISLAPLGKHLRLFQSGAGAVVRAREAQRLWGDAWVGRFLNPQ